MPVSDFVPIITAAGGTMLGGGAVTGWRRVNSQNRRDDAESAKVLAQAYALFTDDLREQIKQLSSDNALLRERIAGLEAHISVLLNDQRTRELAAAAGRREAARETRRSDHD